MDLMPTGLWKKGIVVSRKIPDKWQHLHIQRSASLYREGNFGRYLSQRSRWNGMLFQQINLYINHRMILEVSTKQPFLFLLYRLKGTSTMSLKKTVKNACWLCYFPAGKQHAEFDPGPHVWFVVSLKHTYLTPLTEKLYEVKELVAHARSREKIAYWLEIGRISQQIKQLTTKIAGCTYESPERELYIQSRVKELLISCAVYLKAARTPIPADLSLKEKLASYIAQRLEETITIETIARDLNTSASVLKIKFRILFGMPIHHYIQEQRLQQARHLTVHSVLSIYTIALRTGFTDPSHLIKCFKLRFGVTPGEFRFKNKAHR